MKKVGVVGAGTMGAGIAQVTAEAGYEVILIDLEDKFVNRGMENILKNWSKAIKKGTLTAKEVDQIKVRLTGTTNYDNLNDCQLVIEAVVEKMSIKKELFAKLDDICPAETLFASNTSALSITELAAATKRPNQVIGVHFFNPVPVMKLVELIPGAETTAETVTAMKEYCSAIGKEAIVVKESPGFIVNRLLIPYINEAAIIYDQGVASPAEIDQAMKLGANMPMGPLALADLIGIDVCLMIMEYFFDEMADSKYRPALAFKQKVRAGHLGRKTGKGFFDYN
ncbi:MAG TPA: 3-hydroxybutyryl-CoA dehydrogenase [Syntrophomonas sp.]|nr:3-hydroxyacyl-CoA dehydrogenase NAD-binding domain-containing protein [Bacillota bacterium]HAA09948.1 3-hydroxybutyryl-CoA dehydrogenase [Syntrophomonas sp.]HQA50001.1 3-hydroxyacyl-CoA dehydrogenase NAD-binding domain-containing protein [Syntrophomonadaceae bacterium]